MAILEVHFTKNPSLYDQRGIGASPGRVALFSHQEAEDFYDAIEWAAVQPWSNGKVGLNGFPTTRSLNGGLLRYNRIILPRFFLGKGWLICTAMVPGMAVQINGFIVNWYKWQVALPTLRMADSCYA